MKPTFLASMAFFSTLNIATFAQDVQRVQAPPQASPTSINQQGQSVAMQAFQQGQQALSQELAALLAKGVTAQELMAWNQKNATRFQALADLAKSVNAPVATRSLPIATDSQISRDASQEMKDFVTTQTDISNKFAQFHNQRLQAGVVSKQPGEEWTLFSQQNAAQLQTLEQRGMAMAQKNVPRVLPVPDQTQSTAGMPSEMQAFTAAHDQIMREQAQLMNQYTTADAKTKAAAMQQWQQVNAARLQQLQQLGEKISNAAMPPATPITNNPTTQQATHP